MTTINRLKIMVISIFLLTLTAWLLEGLITTEQIVFPTVNLPDLTAMAIEFFRYLFILLFFALSAGILLILIIERRLFIELFKGVLSKDRNLKDERFLKNIMSFLGFATFIVFLWWVMGSGTINLGFNVVNDQTAQNHETIPSPPSGDNISEPLGVPPLFIVVPTVLIVAASAVFSIIFIQALRETRKEKIEEWKLASAQLEEDNKMLEEAAEVVAESVSKMQASSENTSYRSIIIDCYERLCELLARYNCKIQKHQTVQEFRAAASQLLKLPNEPLTRLCNLFEEARYSLHEIDEIKKNMAIKCLKEISDYLIGERKNGSVKEDS